MVHFGVFELDPKSGELRRNGSKAKLQDQPFQILRLLLGRAGEVVTHEEIISVLWPNGTVVEYEHSVKTAVKKLRQALGDDAATPHYVETLPRRGYRFIYPVIKSAQSEVWHGEAQTVPPRAPADGAALSPPLLPMPASEPASFAPAGSVQDSANLIGKRVSHYRVLGILGKGGMGVVYRAEDTRLGRLVALKFLPDEVIGNAKALERFEREARAASTLNHPNICTIHEIEEHEGRPFIVMELLEGQTLEQLLSSNAGAQQAAPLRTDTVLNLAIQIADGLDAAHQKGIIHRDIKPANIFVTTHGQVKILDFGLAKLSAGAPLAAPQQDVPTAPVDDDHLTRPGAPMGTAAYMSPEQIRGETVDARTDLFSFGLVLYEMVTGRRAFPGERIGIIHEAILHAAPTPVCEINPEAPGKLQEIVTRAMEKDRALRYQSACDLGADLRRLKRDRGSVASGAESDREIAARERHSTYKQVRPLVFASLLVLAVLWAIYRYTQRRPLPNGELKQRQITTNTADDPVSNGAISADGKYVAYADQQGIHVKVIATGDVQSLPQPEALNGRQVDWNVSWYPDGTRLLATANVDGGPPSVWSIAVVGGTARKLRDNAHAWAVSPNGAFIAFTTKAGGCYGDREAWLMGPNGEEAREVFGVGEHSGLNSGGWSPDGQRLIYDEAICPPTPREKPEQVLQTRDLKGGPAVTVISGQWGTENRVRDFIWLRGGRVLYALGEPGLTGDSCNFWVMPVDKRTGKPRGQPRQLTNWAGFCMSSMSASADGERLAFTRYSIQVSSYVGDLESSGTRLSKPRRLTNSEGYEYPSRWAADSKAVIVGSNRSGPWSIFTTPLARSAGEPQLLAESDTLINNICLSPDGAWAIYQVASKDTPDLVFPDGAATVQLMRVAMTGGSPQRILTAGMYGPERCARSPATLCAFAERSKDGKQLIFTSFDPLKGRGHELAHFGVEPHAYYEWDLSPDGKRIAIVTYPAKRIAILSLTDHAMEVIMVKGWDIEGGIDWDAHQTGLYLSSRTKDGGAALLHVDLQGNIRKLLQEPIWYSLWGIPSPDGRHLAFPHLTFHSNVWMMENF